MNLIEQDWLRKALDHVLERPIKSKNDANVQVFTLLCDSDIVYYLFSIWSLIHYLDQPCAIWIINDGSLTADRQELLRTFIQDVHICSTPTSDLLSELSRFPHCTRFLADHVLAKKIFGVYNFAQSSKLVILDSDVLFFKTPHHIINWCNAPPCCSLFMKDSGESESIVLNDADCLKFRTNRIPYFNAGLLCISKDLINLRVVEDVLAFIYEEKANTSRWIWEQTVWAVLVASRLYFDLPNSYLFMNHWSPFQDVPADTICGHFSQGRRHKFLIKLTEF